MGELTGKVALVTGAGPNIGQAIARTLAAKGAAIVCNNLVESIAQDVVEAVKSEGAAPLLLRATLPIPIRCAGS